MQSKVFNPFFRTVDTDIDKSENIKMIIHNEHSDYTLKKFDTDSDYKIAVCSLNKQILNNIIKIYQNSLINTYFRFSIE